MPELPETDEERFAFLDRKLDEQQVKHLELARMVGEYRELLYDLEENPRNEEARRLARGLPGARYRVSTTYIQQNWLQIEAELGKLFPRED